MKPHIKHILDFTLREKRYLIISLFFMVLIVLTTVATPLFLRLLIDDLNKIATGVVTFNDIIRDICLLGFSFILQMCFDGMYQYFTWFISRNFELKFSDLFFERLLKLDYSEHTKKNSNHYVQTFREGIGYSKRLFGNYKIILPMSLSCVLVFIISFFTNFVLALIVVVFFCIGLFITTSTGSRFSKQQTEVNKIWTDMYLHLSDQIANIVTYKVNQDFDYFSKRGKRFIYNGMNAQLDINRKYFPSMLFNTDILGRFLVLSVGAYYVYMGSMTVGSLFMFYGFLSTIFAPINIIDDILPEYNKAIKKVEDFLAVLSFQDKVVDPKKPRKFDLKKVKGNIEVRKAFFSYDSNKKRTILKGVSFSIKPGEKVALVGHSGSGKSTLMSLITRLYDVGAGQILCDGVDIREFRQEDYRKMFGVVLQDNSLYNESIADNIAYGKIGASREEIVKAAKLADADEFISALPEGYDTLVGQRGVRLSGGEKQRIAIARAILKDPKIVILDEPTSALDSITEANVQEGLNKLLKGRSALIIAHRLATVKNADKIVLLHDGEVLAIGSHKELLKSSPEYKKMVDLQVGGFIDEK